MSEYKIEELLNAIDFEQNKLQKTKQDLFLTNYEIAVLKKYHIDYDNCKTAKEILQKVENIISDLDELEQEELDQVEMSIAERDYYQNTNK
ncbi:MAG: hypothetical protein PUE33_02520 [bacterium]|nr:hypothetical protein [Mycoplasmatota bacterium]MDD6756924.1 hypothetical protein [bacterium]MDY2908046.1 hypothetical protein [Candidatus Faecimonas sp.]